MSTRTRHLQGAMHRPWWLVVAGLLLCPLAMAQNAVVDWHAVMEKTIPATGRKNAVALPFYAYADIAMYDAAIAIHGGHRPFAVRVVAPAGASDQAAVAQAAHDVLAHYLPAQVTVLDAALATSLGAIPDGKSKTDGIGVGQSVAAQWLALRVGDGLEAPITYTWGHGPGIWEPVPTLPAPPPNTPSAPVGVWMTQFKPFALTRADQFLAQIPPPPALGSREWVRDYNRTKDWGALNSTLRTAAETEIGLFWTADAAVQYSAAFRGLVASEHLGTAEAARLGAMYAVAASDSVTACMNAKYHFARWRPYTAITNGGTDGNPLTTADPTWEPLAVTPGHPEYPANHGCVTAAVMETWAAFFGTDEVPLTVSSSVTKTTHAFTELSDVVREVDDARIYGGMHFRSSVIAGNFLGTQVVGYLLATRFRPQDD